MSIQSFDGEWLVLRTRPRAEKKVAKSLEIKGVECYLPVQRRLVQWKDRKKWGEVVLFPSYVFVRLMRERRNEVFDIVGVIKYVSFEGIAASVPDADIERIRLICSGTAPALVTEAEFRAGDKVEVIQGPLCGLRGVLSNEVNGMRLHVNISGLGCHLSIIIDRGIVRKL